MTVGTPFISFTLEQTAVNINQAVADAIACGCPVVKVLDNGSSIDDATYLPFLNALAQLKAAGKIIILRVFNALWDNVNSAPGIPSTYKTVWNTRPSLFYADYVTTPNEPGGNWANAGTLTAMIADIHAAGKLAAVGCWLTGTSGFPVPGMISGPVGVGDLYEAHEYSGPLTMWDAWPGNTLHFPTWFPAVLAQQPGALLLIGEVGLINQVPNNGQPAFGWVTVGVSPAVYWQQLLWYFNQLLQYPYVVGACIWEDGATTLRASFEIQGQPVIQQGMTAWNAGRRITIPLPSPSLN